MNWVLAGSLVQLRSEVDAAFPGRSKASDGTIGDQAHAARVSDHNPDRRGVVRAWDCTRDVVDGVDVAERVAEWLRARRDPRVSYSIFRARIFSSVEVDAVPPWTWRPYDGPNPHEHHVHVSVRAWPAGDDARPWGFTAKEEVDMADSVWSELLVRAETEDPDDRLPAGQLLPLAVRYSLHSAQRAAALQTQVSQLAEQVTALTAAVQALAAPPPPVGR